jgi:HEAT repeat protein
MCKLLKKTFFVAALLGAAVANAQDPVANLLSELSDYEYGDVRIPLREAHLWVTNALDSEADSAAVAAALATVLEGDATLDGKQFVCRELARIGGPAEVPVLAELLNSEETADMARYALQPIPGPEADAALIAALDTTSGDVRIGVINSLGERRAEDAISALRKIAKKGSDAEAEAAVAALGKMGTGHARRALRSAKRGASPELRAAIDDAVLVCTQLREAEQS